MRLRACFRSPLFWILAAAAAMRVTGILWGLPASDGWDDDGFAPRNFLTALALTYAPGSYFTYPPLHAFVLAILTWPGAVLALLHAPSLSQHDVVAEITRPATMTYFAVVARLVNVAMSLGIICCVNAMARLVAGPRAGLFAASACALNMSLVYYGQVSNLDVPYLFWCLLSLLWCMRAVASRDVALFRWGFLFAAAAAATKDQAYAVFALSLPAMIAAWFVMDDWPRRHARQAATAIVLSACVALVALLLVDGALTNPSGFARRIAFLAGPASQDYAYYTHDGAGRLALFADMLREYVAGPGVVGLCLAAIGVAVALRRNRGAGRAAALLPFLAILSFTLCFNAVALRGEARFVLPQAVLATVYIGIAADYFLALPYPWLRYGACAALTATALWALYLCGGVNAAFLRDPRYDAEAWMAAHVAPGDTIETYGHNVFLPRFPRNAVVTRIGQGALNVRNPLPHVTELKAPFDAPRDPRFIVVSHRWVWPYLRPQAPLLPGQAYSPIQKAQFADASARRYFALLHEEKLNYRLAHVSDPKTGIWPMVHIHDSLDETVRIFERK